MPLRWIRISFIPGPYAATGYQSALFVPTLQWLQLIASQVPQRDSERPHHPQAVVLPLNILPCTSLSNNSHNLLCLTHTMPNTRRCAPNNTSSAPGPTRDTALVSYPPSPYARAVPIYIGP